MYTYLTIIVILVGVISLVGTLLVGKKVDKDTEEFSKAEDRTAAQLKRSHDYETSSVKGNLKVLTIIYVLTFLLSIVALAVYIFLI